MSLAAVYRNSDGSYQIEERERRLKVIPVGGDALVVLINRESSLLESITKSQLRDVLTGKITRWDQRGVASDKPINRYVRQGKISGVGAP